MAAKFETIYKKQAGLSLGDLATKLALEPKDSN